MRNRNLILLGVIISFSLASLGIVHALASTGSPNNSTNSTNIQPVSNPISNSTLQSLTIAPKSPNHEFTFVKYPGYDMQFVYEVKNPVKLSGNVTDPKGKVHPVNIAATGGGKMRFSYYAAVSDPDGSYTIQIDVMRGSNTEDLSVGATFTNHVMPPQALATPPP